MINMEVDRLSNLYVSYMMQDVDSPFSRVEKEIEVTAKTLCIDVIMLTDMVLDCIENVKLQYMTEQLTY